MNRRTVLASTGLALSLPLAGCLDDFDAEGSEDGEVGLGNQDGDDDGRENEDDECDRRDPSDEREPFEYDVKQLGILRATHDPLEGESAVGHLEVFASPETARDRLPLDEIDHADGRAESEAFVDETDFDEELLLYVLTEWPKTTDAELEVRELDGSGGSVFSTVAAIGDDPTVGDDAPSFPVALVRVFVGDRRPDTVELTVVDGRGKRETIEVDEFR